MGDTGDIGPDGPQGLAGSVGPTGFAGPQGPQGPAGPAGPRGPTGAVGPAGTTGVQGPAGAMGETGCQGEQGRSSHTVWTFDTTIDNSIVDTGNYQTLKWFFVPAGTLTTSTAIRILGLSHSNSVGNSTFRVRIEDSAFNNLAVEVQANQNVHKYGAFLFRDSFTNGVQLLANDVCCSVPGYGFSSTVSTARDIYVYYEVRIGSATQSWTSDFLMSEIVWDF